MDLKLPTFPHLSLFSRRDPGISIRRANRHWLLAIAASALVFMCGASVAYYELIGVERDDLVLTDPITTARYRANEITAALERYDALRSSYIINPPEVGNP